MDKIVLKAAARDEFGKGAARRLRREGLIPAVLYGHGADPEHLTLPYHDTALALRNPNALLTLEVEGHDDKLALPKQVQRDPLKRTIEHVDLIVVRRGEKVTVDVTVVVEGEAGPDTLVVVEHNTISVEAEATHIPESVEVSVEGLAAGTQILAKDLALPAGATYQGEEDDLIVNVTEAPTQAQLEADLEVPEGEGGAEAAEPAEGEADAAAESDGE